jgi:hypothetical protein
MNFSKIIVSSNEDARYIEFWPIIAATWNRMFNVPVHLALLSTRKGNDGYVQWLRQFGKVTVFKPIPGIPESNLARVIRFILATQESPNEVVYINNIDLLPLNRDYFMKLTGDRPQGHLLCVGAEICQDGKFPVGSMTAEAAVFQAVFNPRGLSYESLVQDWAASSDLPSLETFSDETLVRDLLATSPVPRWDKPRGWSPYTAKAICRSDWHIDLARLNAGDYVEARLLQPYVAHAADIQPLVDYCARLSPILT